MAKTPKPPATQAARPVEAFTHSASRRNIPTAELQSLAQQAEEAAPVPPARYPRGNPLADGTTRLRDADRDPQLVWNGMTIRITEAQKRELAETGTLTLGEAQLVWRGKDTQDWSDLVVQPPPIYVQEKVHPKAIIADLQRQSATRRAAAADTGPDLFADFNGLPDPEARLEFYQHDQHWSNRMILGDSLQVMASLAEREGLRGKVQCIYVDPPYGIKFNSNWQVSTQSRDVKDGKQTDISREPEQVKAFRDTWKDGIHSYLTYLRDRLTVARELLTDSGSIFVQIGDENVHRVRAVMDEVFGEKNFLGLITFRTGSGFIAKSLKTTSDYIVWFGKDSQTAKFRRLFSEKPFGEATYYDKLQNEFGDVNSGAKPGISPFALQTPVALRPLVSAYSENTNYKFKYRDKEYYCGRTRCWKTTMEGMERLSISDRIQSSENTLKFVARFPDFPNVEITHVWEDTMELLSKHYVVQTSTKVAQRCILMASDPGDLVLDPTCGSGTTATVAEQWGRRWITIDTSRVALALARTRIMAAKFPYYLLTDSNAGRAKEAMLTGKPAPYSPEHHDLRQGFVYERAPHVTLKSIANNAEIDVLWAQAQTALEPLRVALNDALGQDWQEWQIPREAGDPWPKTVAEAWRKFHDASTDDAARTACLHTINHVLHRAYTTDDLPAAPSDPWPDEPTRLHAAWWETRIARQRAIDASIARKAEVELLYDRPYEDNKRVRVAGPFTVESLSPHRVLPHDDMELIDELDAAGGARAQIGPRGAAPPTDFAAMVLDHLRTAGVHQHTKDAGIVFDSLTPWPGTMIAAEGTYSEGETTRRAAILIGPEFGTLTRPDITRAAREASDARFDVLIACAFNYDAHAADLTKLGPLPILQARINPDLHMSDELKNTGKGNLFVVFGAPDIQLHDKGDGMIAVQVLGVDVFDPQTGDVRSGGTESIAAWFIDTMYNEESFFVRHAYFLGANDPYKSLKTALRAEIDEDAWASLYRDTSRPFPRPETGRIAVKVINHFGDEVMKVFGA